MTYMVAVEGKQAPSKEHEFYQDAKDEAIRLASKPDNRSAKIYILEIKAVMMPVFSHRLVER
jgi:hypothetical protein